MTPSEINIKCAEFCGWRYAGGGIWEHPDGRSQKRCPCYDTDPAAMWELWEAVIAAGLYISIHQPCNESGDARIAIHDPGKREAGGMPDTLLSVADAPNPLLALALATAKMKGH